MASKHEFLRAEAKSWLESGLIDEPTYANLLGRYPAASVWNLRVVARWSLLVGSLCLGVGLITLITLAIDSPAFLSMMLTVGAGGIFVLGLSLTRQTSKQFFPKTGNALIVVACLLLGADVFSVARLIFPSGDHWEGLLLVISTLYFATSYLTKNSTVLTLALVAVAGWYGAESGYMSGWGAYFFGMNYPLRFALAAPLVIVVGALHQGLWPRFAKGFSKVYFVLGLLYFNLALWILSIFGSRDEILIEAADGHLELAFFSLIWLVLCVALVIIGARFRNRVFVGFGVTFVAINLYTRYYEYFWNALDKWVFFVVIGALTLGAGFLVERHQKSLRRQP